MTADEYDVYAKQLMERWGNWFRASYGKTNTSRYWKLYQETSVSLKEKKLLRDRSRADRGDFILRHTIHGSPILITVGGEIVFRDFFFAQACHKVCKEYTGYQNDNVQILQVM